MSDETFAAPTSGEPGPALTAPSEEDYDAICAAVMETVRGRWFLSEYSRRNRHSDTELVLAAIDRVESTLRGEQTNQSIDRFRYDLMEMAKAISRTKSEIAAIKPAGESHGTFADVTEELDSVVQANQQATSSILDSAVQIQEVAWTMREQGNDAGLADQLDARAAEIHTAGSIQELASQRTQKVVHVMRYLEGRINAMIDVWGDVGKTGALAAPPRNGHAPPHEGHDEVDAEVDAMMTGPSPLNAHQLNGNGHDAAPANGHMVIADDIEAAMREAVAAANVIEADSAEGAKPPTEIEAATTAPALETSSTPDEPRSEQAATTPILEQEPPTPPATQALEPGEPGSEAQMPTSYSEITALVFPAEGDGAPLPLLPHESTPAPLVVASEPAFQSGPVAVTPDNEWANTAAADAMTAPALDAVVVISDHDDDLGAASAIDGVTGSRPDLYALHMERSIPPKTEYAATEAAESPNTDGQTQHIPIDIIAPSDADAHRDGDDASVIELRAKSKPAAVVFDFELEPLSTGVHGQPHVHPESTAANLSSGQDTATTTEASTEPVPDLVAASRPEPKRLLSRLWGNGVPESVPEARTRASAEVAPSSAPALLAATLEPTVEPRQQPAPLVTAPRAEPKPDVVAQPRVNNPEAKSVGAASAEQRAVMATAVEPSAATPAAPVSIALPPTTSQPAAEVSAPPVATVKPSVAQPAAPSAAMSSGNVKLLRPQPAAAPIDPLAAIEALSDEEKIALFS
jgi:chemotaxis protein CheZ